MKAKLFFLLAVFFGLTESGRATVSEELELRAPAVAVIEMSMMILPGTQAFLEQAISSAERDGVKLLVIKLNTPGGILQTAQEMVQMIAQSPVPIAVYVAPSGSTATSAGVFITLAGHIAAMAPGTSIGAAHPVAGDGRDIEGDMRTKAENMTAALAKSVSELRGRNVEWAEEAVKTSQAITNEEAVAKQVVDLIAEDLDDLLKKVAGREVSIRGTKQVTLEDYSSLPRRTYEMHFQHRVINVLANPNVVALLWLGATTGLSLELYNPGGILPGVVGVICLLLALMASQIIPITQTGVLLLIVGTLLIGAELFVPSGILGIGGVIALAFGALYLIDVSQAPGLQVSMELIIPVVVVIGGFMLLVLREASQAFRQKAQTGSSSLEGKLAKVVAAVTPEGGKVFLEGEYWNAVSDEGELAPGRQVEVLGFKEGLTIRVRAPKTVE